ncbi:Serine/threonine-protein kinase HipA [Oligella ureolytica]|uniref:Serine/threonine-protein kinase HipA n=1 Tax=Oligella ureolytica TaxID=90244 RepID=A0A378XIH4_9BURK|nr:type II toxin-antitoxin system HipA family toxin [Oligella ureolytica]QPT39705.1 type II toxin-antitoxin system HipA family toxin [Oligella ureolytica]SUA52370.1 Serine/threonine-protein kinase HipA [Oligella ureolytica]SUA57257.1 Serine/threonine-protein kinase HipA [Oligella ureolytica]
MANSYSISAQELQQNSIALEVFVNNRAVGVIEKQSLGYAFQYYANTKSTDFVSLTMPVRTTPYFHYRDDSLHPIFDMNLPEGGLRSFLIQKYSKVISSFNELALLSIVGQTMIGRITYGGIAKKVDSTFDLQRLVDCEDTEDLLLQLYTETAHVSGIAGVQPKALIDIDEQSIKKLSDQDAPGQDLKITFKTSSSIIKTSGKEYLWLAANEFYCLRAARLSNIGVPDFLLLKGGQILVVSRFDRKTESNSELSLLGLEDFCVLNGLTSKDKYTLSYERVIKTLSTFVSPHYRNNDMEELFRSIAFNSVIRNGDAHLKNFSVLYDEVNSGAEEPDVLLSPAFDLCTTNAYIPKDMLALILDGSKRYPTRKKLELFALRHCGLLPERTREILAEIENGVFQAAQELSIYCHQQPEFANQVGSNMLRFWQAGLESLKSTLKLPEITTN